MSAAPGLKIEPTIRDRSGTLDFLRGVAILGILMANAEAFYAPLLDSMMATGQSKWWDSLEAAFVSGKFRSMLSILFGIGLWSQFLKRGNDRHAWPGGYLKRNIVLAGIGAIHAILIWPGDILVAYAFTAMVACLFVRASDQMLWRIIIGLMILTSICGVGCGAGMWFIEHMPEALGGSSSSANPMEMPSWEADAVRSGSFLNVLGARALAGMMSLMNASALVVFGLPLFLFGILLGRVGVLQRPSEHPEWTKGLLIFGWVVGGLTNFPVLVTLFNGGAFAPQVAIDFGFSPYLAVAYLITGAILAEKVGAALNPFRNVGRVALSNYLLQSLVMNHLFLILGWYQRATPAQVAGSVIGMWVINLIFSALWLRKFDIGPIEWVLRSVTEGKKLPWRYGPVSAPAAPSGE